MSLRTSIIKKVNEGQEPDVRPFTWRNIPQSIKDFWKQYFEDERKNRKFANN